MEVRDWITITAAIIVVIGWFVNSWLNRRHEVAKKRMDHRLDALLSFLPVLFAIQENRAENEQFSKDIASCWTKFQLYCFRSEVEEFEKLCIAIERGDKTAYSEALQNVTRLVKDRVREELGLDEFMHKPLMHKITGAKH